MAGCWSWDAAAKRRWWRSLAVAAVLGVPACSDGPDVEAVERALVAEVGPPLPDATVFDTPWYHGVGIWYDHRDEPDAVLGWLDELPSRLRCASYESDDLVPPKEGWSELYRVSCRVRKGDSVYVVSVRTLLGSTSSSTTVVAFEALK
jgi:hypothetical protein